MPELLNPWLMSGAALAAVPVIFHLLMRPRPKVLEFPALRFVRARHNANRRQMRLRNLLLLLLRMAVIVLIALALARPTSQNVPGLSGKGDGPVAVALLIDTLPHMDYRYENKSRLDVARETADWLLGQLPEDSQVAVIDSASTASAFQVDRSSAAHYVERLKIDEVGQPLWKQIAPACRLLKTSELPKEIYVLTDLARSAWKSSAESELGKALKDADVTGLYLIDVGVEKPHNFGLGPLKLSAETVSRGSSLSIGTELLAVGPGGQRTVESYLVDRAGQLQKRDEALVDAQADGSVAVSFSLSGLDEGVNQGMVKVLGGDGLTADDSRYFTVVVRPAWRVLIVAPEPRHRQASYLAKAIAPEEYRRAGRAKFTCDIQGYGQLSGVPLDQYAAVYLLDPSPLPDAVWQQLGSFVQGGGGLAVCAGPGAQPLASFNSAAAREVLPAALGFLARHPNGDLYLPADESDHPALARFVPLRGNIAWDNFPIYRHWTLGEAASAMAVVARYSDGLPALVERPIGRGRVLLLDTPISEAPGTADAERWNMLPTGFEPWPFVMLVDQMTLYLVGNSERSFNYQAGQPAVIQLEPDERRPTYLLSRPDRSGEGERVAPDESTLVIPRTEDPGNYRIDAGGEKDRVHLGFSANLPADATQLARVDKDELAQVFGDFKFQLARDRIQVDRVVSSNRVGREWFPYIILALCLAMGFEYLTANRFYREVPDKAA
ncbi:MAG: BatA domain-containing protein [Planctomycetes bacterium]|nr:BatA domain-containing protein [Planctomycetota bacterium]